MNKTVERYVIRLATLVARATLRLSPWPIIVGLRMMVDGPQSRRGVWEGAPPGVQFLNERYGEGNSELLDVYLPHLGFQARAPVPVVAWIHGGSFVAGHKDDQASYFRALSCEGCAVISIEYSHAPEARFPNPIRQVVAALAYLKDNAERFGIDCSRIVLAGDSAGANICVQVALVATNVNYGSLLEVDFDADPKSIVGVVLCCAVLDVMPLPDTSPVDELVSCVADAVGWAYSGVPNYREDDHFVTAMSLGKFVTDDFPPAFMTVGNADPLRGQSINFARQLRGIGITVDTLFVDEGHVPRLGHEYQFDLETIEGRAALSRIVSFTKGRWDALR